MTRIDLPVDLHRKLKAEAAIQGKTLRKLVSEILQGWLTQKERKQKGKRVVEN